MSKILDMIFQDGVQEGESKKALDIAMNALREGLGIKDISEITGLDTSTIEKLKAEIKIM